MNDSIGMPERDAADRIHRLAIRQLDGSLSEVERAELVALLQGEAAVRRAYLEHMQDTVSLRWMFSGHLSRKAAVELAEHGPERMHARQRRLSQAALVLAASLACVAAFSLWRASGNAAKTAVADGGALKYVAMVTELSDVKWMGASPAYRRMARVAVGQEFEFASGSVELTFDAFAKVKVFGPAKFTVKDAKLIACTRGRVTTQVDEGGEGFAIETPKARIVDLGTEFGVDISESGDTQVVVFQGSVDLDQPAERADAAASEQKQSPRRRTLEQGDALLLGADGAQRVMAVQRGDFFPTNLFDHYGRPRRAAVILDVRDNIRELESTKCYQIVWGGLREDAPCFVDRSHQWNGKTEAGMPEFLLGADYIMPFNDDKFLPDLRVDVTLARAATCYVFFDDNMTPPEWLTRDFKDTGFDISLDGAKTQWHKDHDLGVGPGVSLDFPFSVWSRDLPAAGVVSFGGVQPPQEKTRSRGFNMYGIAVVPK
jgi:hypothetical protein